MYAHMNKEEKKMAALGSAVLAVPVGFFAWLLIFNPVPAPPKYVPPPPVSYAPMPLPTPGYGTVCNDGWVSQSHGRGMCSHHGGAGFRR